MNDQLNHIKRVILEFISTCIDLSSHRYKLITEYETNKDSIIFPNYDGSNSLAVFLKHNNKYFSFLIERKSIPFKITNMNVDELKLYKIRYRTTEEIYKGTILDGVFIKSENTYIINDVYMFCGGNYEKKQFPEKNTIIKNYINTKFVQDKHLNNISIILNTIYPYTQLNSILETISTLPCWKYIKGIVFYYNFSRYIFLFKKSQDTINFEIIQNSIMNNKEINDNNDNLLKLVLNHPSLDKNIMKNAFFRIKKSTIVDVYPLLLIKKSIKNSQKIIRYKKYDIAYIPTIELSIFCRGLFDLDSDNIIVLCYYHNAKKRWIPMEYVAAKKIPDSISHVKKLIFG